MIRLAVLQRHPDKDAPPPETSVGRERRSMLDWIRRSAPNTVDGM
jgi:hypothetical protein